MQELRREGRGTCCLHFHEEGRMSFDELLAKRLRKVLADQFGVVETKMF